MERFDVKINNSTVDSDISLSGEVKFKMSISLETRGWKRNQSHAITFKV